MTTTIPDQTRQTAAERRAWIIAECDHAAFMGESLHLVARRLGYRSPANLATMLTRWGRPDLADRLHFREVAA